MVITEAVNIEPPLYFHALAVLVHSVNPLPHHSSFSGMGVVLGEVKGNDPGSLSHVYFSLQLKWRSTNPANL